MASLSTPHKVVAARNTLSLFPNEGKTKQSLSPQYATYHSSFIKEMLQNLFLQHLLLFFGQYNKDSVI